MAIKLEIACLRSLTSFGIYSRLLPTLHCEEVPAPLRPKRPQGEIERRAAIGDGVRSHEQAPRFNGATF